MTWTTAGLSPDKGGPPWRKQWPIILPAIRNRSLSTRCADEDGTRWSGSPSKILVIWAFPEKQENKIFCGRTLKKTKVRQCGLKNWWSKGIPKLRWKPHFNFCVVIENKKRFTPSPIAGSPRKWKKSVNVVLNYFSYCLQKKYINLGNHLQAWFSEDIPISHCMLCKKQWERLLGQRCCL